MKPEKQGGIDGVILSEVQVILAEKRTALSMLRTGIAILALPLSVLSVLVATSRYYDAHAVLYLLLPIFLLNAGLVLLAIYLVTVSIRRARHCDHLLLELKRKHSKLAEFIS